MKLTFDKARWSQEGDGFWLHLRVTESRLAQKFIAAMKAGKRYIAEMKERRNKRSMDANAYYWVLIGKLAPVLRVSSTAAHNLMLRRYGQPEIIEDKLVYVVIPETEEAERKTLESETYHIKPTSQTKEGNDGMTYRTYTMLKGSHEYNTQEMSVLINGIVDECQMQGIETKTPDELALMMARYRDG